MYKVRFAHKAERDLREAKDYIAKHLLNPEAAYRLLDSTQKAVDSLSVFPKRNPLVREPLIASQGIRWTQVQQYLLFYTVEESEKTVIVLHFLSARQDWKRLLGESNNGFLPRS